MADIIAKIGKYFAEQESQMREMYAQAAAAEASASVPAKSAAKAPVQPSGDGLSADYRRGSVDDAVIERPPSLLRRRLLTTTTTHHPAVDTSAENTSSNREKDARRGPADRQSSAALTSRSDGEASSESGSRSTASMMSDAAALSASSTSSSSRKVKVVKKKKKVKKKKSETEEQMRQKRQLLEMKAEEGLARAQERARRIQMEKVEQQRQQQQEKEANAARLQEEMRKIEEIRQKGKQFALRLRPQSAPSTPQSSQTVIASSRWKDTADGGQEKQEKDAKRTFLDELEREMHDRMVLELAVNERAHRKYTQEQEEWAKLQSQIKKTSDRNAIRADRVRSLAAKKEELEQQIEQAQSEAMRSRQQRHELEEKSKKERLQRQREAEREIHARLRKEESQRLVDEERKQSDEAAEARAKAKLRVQSRASLLKRVLHGFDVRAERTKSTNQEESSEQETNRSGDGQGSGLKREDEGPELAEFEEDGLVEELSSAQPASEVYPVSPTKLAMHPFASGFTSRGLRPPTQFEWRVPSLLVTEIHNILRKELLTGHIDN